MVKEGYAVAYRKQSGCGAYITLENTAKAQKLGVWSDPNFVLPGDYKPSVGKRKRRHSA